MRIIRWLKCFWYGHDIRIIRHLNVLAKVQCKDCKRVFMMHRHESGMLSWRDEWDGEFDRWVEVGALEEP